jgi:hypothetical protein
MPSDANVFVSQLLRDHTQTLVCVRILYPQKFFRQLRTEAAVYFENPMTRRRPAA